MGPRAARQAPVAYGLVLLHPIPTLVFTFWAVDAILHCNDEDVTCGLGFAIHLLFPTAVALIVAFTVGVLAWVVRPDSRLQSWVVLLAPVSLTLVTLWWALAVTKS